MSETLDQLRERYREYCDMGLALDMTRGKPSAEQLDLSNGMLGLLGPGAPIVDGDGVACSSSFAASASCVNTPFLM